MNNIKLSDVVTPYIDWKEGLSNSPVLVLKVKNTDQARLWMADLSNMVDTASLVVSEMLPGATQRVVYAGIGEHFYLYGLGTTKPQTLGTGLRVTDGMGTVHMLDTGSSLGSSRPGFVNQYLPEPVCDIYFDTSALPEDMGFRSMYMRPRAMRVQSIKDHIAPLLLEQGVHIFPVTSIALSRISPREIAYRDRKIVRDIDGSSCINNLSFLVEDCEIDIGISLSSHKVSLPEYKERSTSVALFDDYVNHADWVATLKLLYRKQREWYERDEVKQAT